MPRLPLLAPTVLMSLGLLPGACLAQQGFPYGTPLPARPIVTNVPVAATGWGIQATPPRGPKTITFSSATAANLPSNPPATGTIPGEQLVAPTNGSMPLNNLSAGQQTAPLSSAEQTSRVTNPMLQNMSNPSNLSFEGLATGQQAAPNTYFGRQFDNWGNMRDATTMMPASFGGLSQTPPQPFGIYYAPNTYVGTGFSNWSNLSSGVVTPNPLGGWNYSTR